METRIHVRSILLFQNCTRWQPSCNVTTESSQDPVIFDREVINPGGRYDSSTGYYIVPYDGIYQFHVQIQSYSPSHGVIIQIHVDGNVSGSHIDNEYHDGYRSATVLLELQAGQVVSVYGGSIQGDNSRLFSFFHGYMIAEN